MLEKLRDVVEIFDNLLRNSGEYKNLRKFNKNYHVNSILEYCGENLRNIGKKTYENCEEI